MIEKTEKSKEIYDSANAKIQEINNYLESLKIVF